MGNLASLRGLYLDENPVGGALPASLGSLGVLRRLSVDYTQLSGALPSGLAGLESLWAGDTRATDLCEPTDSAFHAWLAGVRYWQGNGKVCALELTKWSEPSSSPAGGPLTISAREENLAEGNSLRLAPGKYVCLALEDKGEGMTQDTISHATEPFFTTKGIGKGTGLGLSICYQIAEEHGGTIRLEPGAEQGACFVLELPVPSREP